MEKNKISLVIPTWNGEKLLRKNLSKVLAVLPKGVEVIIVDDGSTDGSIKYLKSQISNLKSTFKGLNLRVIQNEKNCGFIYSCNRGVKEARGEFIVLLNNDVVPQRGFLEAALRHFGDPKVFAINFNEPQYNGYAKIWWRGGFVHHGLGKCDKAHICAWASGGSAVYRKSLWEELGGFDPLYHPFYWEDFDLGYRAWKAGYKIIWEPNAIVEHRHESTTSKLNKYYVNQIKERNQLLFIWKNISDFWWRFSNIFGVVLRTVLGPNYLKVVWMAIKQYRKFSNPRAKREKLTDKEVLRLFE
jgi:GT2 family glycosyltransferase